MSKTFTLSVSDRINLCRYINLLTCTTAIRLVIDDFIDNFKPTMDEYQKAGVHTDDGEIVKIEDDYTKEFSSDLVPECIRNGIIDFCESLNANKNAPKEYVDKVTSPLKKVL